MARIIDENKLGRIKEAAIQLIVENGYGGASIATIAKKAQVAEGYLYRFYKSKEAFVNALLYEKISCLIEKMELLVDSMVKTNDIIRMVINEFFTMANNNHNDIKFLYVLMHDYNFQIQTEQRNNIQTITRKILIKGKNDGDIGNRVGEDEIYIMVITYPIVFLNLRLKNFFNTSMWTEKDQEKVFEFCIKSLKD